MRPFGLIATLPLVLSACSGEGSVDAGRPDAYTCTEADLARVVESDGGAIGGEALRYVFGANRVSLADGGLLDAWIHRDGTLLIKAVLPDGRSPSGYSSFMTLNYLDGRIVPVARVWGADSWAVDDELLLRADGGVADEAAPFGAAFQLELYDHTGALLAESSREMLPEPICNGVNPDTAHLSAGRLLVLRNDCAGGAESRWLAERWERRGAVLERAAGPFRLSARAVTNRFGGDPPTAYADGLGGVFWGELVLGGGGWSVAAGHFDGDTEPTYSEPLLPPGLTTEFLLARPYPGGRLLLGTNYRATDGRLRTLIVLLRRDAETGALTPEWRWESSGLYYSGPYNPAFDVVGEGEVLVLLTDQRARDGVYVQRISREGLSMWPEPREAYRNVSLRLSGLGTALRVVGHQDGTAHLLFADPEDERMLRVDALGDPQGEPLNLSFSDLGLGGYSDGHGGVWAITNDRDGTLLHAGADGWLLHRAWSVPGCGGVHGLITRPGPEAEAHAYLGDPIFE
ncbi:MAG: hypothetical protein K1X94_34105 [Sandaracinaceae bacterium]|nr:hypothetical protein [Sandaracinaceae bacterium]